MKRIFMGGTCEGYDWREELVEQINSDKAFCFNPVVEDWNEEAQANELHERDICDICLYTITPSMAGCYSIAEVVDDSNKRPDKTAFIVIPNADGKTFSDKMIKSLDAVKKLVERNGGKVFNSIEDFANYVNGDNERTHRLRNDYINELHYRK